MLNAKVKVEERYSLITKEDFYELVEIRKYTYRSLLIKKCRDHTFKSYLLEEFKNFTGNLIIDYIYGILNIFEYRNHVYYS